MSGNSVDVYRGKVDTIKTDLEKLKTETDEFLKQQQAETIECEAEKIKKEIEAEIEKIQDTSDGTLVQIRNQLQEMLDDLEGFLDEITTLKASILVGLQETETQANETLPMVNTAPEFEKITTDMEELKTMVNELEGIVDEYKKNKKTLTDEEKKEKEQEITDKQTAIREKKKAIQEAINTIKQTRKDFDINGIGDEELKKTLKNQKQTDLQKVADIQKELDAISVPASNFFETIQNSADKTWKRAKRNPWATGGIVAGGVLLVGWMAGLFRRKNKETSPTTQTTNNEAPKKGFWKRAWNIIKWPLGIGSGYYLIHGLITGKWNFKDLFDWTKKLPDNLDRPGDQYKGYKEFKEENPESAERYEKFGHNIDVLYENIFDEELASGREDDASMDSISKDFGEEELKGIVPWCMDNSFSNVDSILSERGIGIDLYQQDFKIFKIKILNRLKGSLGGGLKLFLQSLPSWAKLGIGDNLEDKFSTWFDTDTDVRVKEIKSFFRQQMRVTVFLKTKEAELIYAIAEKCYRTDNDGFENISDAIKDNDRFKRNVEKDSDYQSFRRNNISNAYNILNKYNIMHGDIDEDTKAIVDAANENRRDILDGPGGNDIISKCEKDMEENNSLNNENKENLVVSCNKIIQDIVKLEKKVEKDARDMYSNLFNTSGANKQEILEHSTLAPLLREIRDELPDLIDKIEKGEWTLEDMKALKAFVNTYFAIQKELDIGVGVYQLIKRDNTSWTLRLTGFFTDMLGNLKEGTKRLFKKDLSGFVRFLAGSAPIALITADILWFTRRPLQAIKYHLLAPVVVPGKIYQATLWTAKTLPNGKYIGPAGSLRRMFFANANGPNNLRRAMKNGKISLSKAQKIVKGGNYSLTPSTRQRWSIFYAKDEVLFKRGLIKNAFGNTITDEVTLDIMAKYFDNKSFNNILVNNTTEGIKILKVYEGKISTLSTNQQKFFIYMTDNEKIPLRDLDDFINNKIDKIVVNAVPDSELKKMAKHVGKNIGDFNTVEGINTYISTRGTTVPNPVVRPGTVSSSVPNIAGETAEQIAKRNTAAYKIYEKRIADNTEFMKQFDQGGKYEKYADFKQKYLDAVDDVTKRNLDTDFARRLLHESDDLDFLINLTNDQKNIYKSVRGDINMLESVIEANRQSSTYTPAMRSADEIRVKDMKAFIRDVDAFVPDDIDAFYRLKNIGLKTEGLVELLRLKKINQKIGEVLTESSDDFNKLIKTLKSEKEAGIHITDELIRSLDDINTKGVLSVADDIAKFFKKILRFLKFIR